jgi:hypothetical protein
MKQVPLRCKELLTSYSKETFFFVPISGLNLLSSLGSSYPAHEPSPRSPTIAQPDGRFLHQCSHKSVSRLGCKEPLRYPSVQFLFSITTFQVPKMALDSISDGLQALSLDPECFPFCPTGDKDWLREKFDDIPRSMFRVFTSKSRSTTSEV